jgi:hypothetical protein
MSGLISKKMKKRLEGVVGLGKVVAERNPIAQSVLTVKETADSAHKILYGKDPHYLRGAVPNRFRPTPKRYQYQVTPKRRFGAKVDRSLDRLLEKDPVKEAIREAKARGDYRAVYALKRLSR